MTFICNRIFNYVIFFFLLWPFNPQFAVSIFILSGVIKNTEIIKIVKNIPDKGSIIKH